MSNHDWLPDDLLAGDDGLGDLYAAERRAPGPPAGADDRVKAAVFASVAAGAALGSGAAAATSATTKALAASGAASGAATGASTAATTAAVVGSGAALVKPAAVVVAAVVATAGGGVFVANYQLPERDDDAAHVVVEAAPRPVPPAGLVLERAPPQATAKAPALPEEKKPPKKAEPKREATVEAPPKTTTTTVEAPAQTTPTAPEPTAEQREAQRARLAEERALIGEARGALGRGDLNAALVALSTHHDAYATGALAEEREALTIMALARVGRRDEAQSKAQTFAATWPKSLFQQAVEDALR